MTRKLKIQLQIIKNQKDMKLDIQIVKENVTLVNKIVTADKLPEIVETMLENVHNVEITIIRQD